MALSPPPRFRSARERHAALVASFLGFYHRAKEELKKLAVSICASINDDMVDDELVQLYMSAASTSVDLCSTLTALNAELVAFLLESPYRHAEHVPSDVVVEVAPEFDYPENLTYEPIEDVANALVAIRHAFEHCVSAEYNMRKTDSLDVRAQFQLATHLGDSSACVASLFCASTWSNADKFMLDDV